VTLSRTGSPQITEDRQDWGDEPWNPPDGKGIQGTEKTKKNP
jgi:hypothetical protein